MLSYLKRLFSMRRAGKDFMNFGEIKKELDKLLFAWREYVERELFYREGMKKFLVSLGIGLSISCISGSLFVWIKTVYAQGRVALAQIPSFSISAAFPWIMCGSLLSMFVGFARANYRLFKRCFDFIVAGVSLIVLSPLFLIIALLVKIDSSGPVFFKQDRVVEDGEIFKIWKFRTMRNNA
jgi:hypothetical protein